VTPTTQIILFYKLCDNVANVVITSEGEVNSAVNGGPMLLASTMVDASQYTLMLKLHCIELICCGFVANLFVEQVDDKSNQRSLSLTVHVCANNQQLSVSVVKCFQHRPT